MENRRPLRVVAGRGGAPKVYEDVDILRAPSSKGMNAGDNAVEDDEDSLDLLSGSVLDTLTDDGAESKEGDTSRGQEGEEVVEEEAGEVSSETAGRGARKAREEVKRKKKPLVRAKPSLHVLGAILIYLAVQAGILFWAFDKSAKELDVAIRNRDKLAERIGELDKLLKMKLSAVDLADYLEGARIIHEKTSPRYERSTWLGKKVLGGSGEMAIDKSCAKGNCFAFQGSEGRLAIAFNSPSQIGRVALMHPLLEKRKSAVKDFSLHVITRAGDEMKIGDFQYELPGDAFQKFVFPSVEAAGIILRVKSNHGHPHYTCIYKVYAFE